MDFNRLNTKAGAERGATLHLKHPALGHLLYSGDGTDADGRAIDRRKKPTPVTVTVLGVESSAVQARAKELQRRRMKRKDDDDEEIGLEFVCSLVVAFSGLERDGKPMEATEENKRLFFEQSGDLVRQVLDFATESGNFFATASGS